MNQSNEVKILDYKRKKKEKERKKKERCWQFILNSAKNYVICTSDQTLRK